MNFVCILDPTSFTNTIMFKRGADNLIFFYVMKRPKTSILIQVILTGCFISDPVLALHWTSFSLNSCMNSLQHIFVSNTSQRFQQLFSSLGWCLNDAQLVVKDPKYVKKLFTPPWYQHHQSWIHPFMLLVYDSDPTVCRICFPHFLVLRLWSSTAVAHLTI